MLDIKRISYDEAKILMTGAVDASRDAGIPMCIAVADESGNLVLFDRMDGAKISSIATAIDKAFTAAAAKRGTHIYNQLCVPGQPTYGIHNTNGGRFSVIGGGLPVTVDGEVIGGIGISSGTAIEDLAIAERSLEHFYQKTSLAR
jgi:uncharacterized protein GlcG (DUF336 family)